MRPFLLERAAIRLSGFTSDVTKALTQTGDLTLFLTPDSTAGSSKIAKFNLTGVLRGAVDDDCARTTRKAASTVSA